MVKLNNKGETLIETLVATLIIVLVISGFANIIRQTVKINNIVAGERISFDSARRSKEGNYLLRIVNRDDTSENVKYDKRTASTSGVQFYWNPDNGLYYYEYDEK